MDKRAKNLFQHLFRHRHFTIAVVIVVLLSSLVAYIAYPHVTSNEKEMIRTLKAGFIYVDKVGDYGWSNAHDFARLYLERKFPWLKTVYAEAVPEADVDRYIDRMVTEGCDIIFTTSSGYINATIAAGKKYPDKIFMNCEGEQRSRNVGTYFADFYQAYYLNGLMAGALTKSNKIGFVGAYPTHKVIRYINAYALGAKEVNPDVKVMVSWTYNWYNPALSRRAAEGLIQGGIDVIAYNEDSPSVIEVAQVQFESGVPTYAFGHYIPMKELGPDVIVSGQLVHWEVLYEEILMRAYLGTWDNRDYFWLLREGAVELGIAPGEPINPKVPLPQNIRDLVMQRLAEMSEPSILFDPFTGPIYDQAGNLRIEKGRRARLVEFRTMDWFVDNVVLPEP